MKEKIQLTKSGKIPAISLFSGCGGMDLGFEKEGFEVVWALDNDYHACQTFRKNFGDKIVNRDIIEVDFSTVPDCEVILGGFPCQDFSVIWRRPGIHGLRGDLYRHFVRAVISKRPKAFVAENVKGLLSANSRKAFSQIVSDFRKVGYRVSAHVYNFAEYGVPQFRERLIIVGIRNDIEFEFEAPKPTHGPGLKPFKTSGQALLGVGKVKHNNEKMKIAKKTKQMLKIIPPGGNFSDVPKSSPYYVKGLISHVYRRLDKNKPAYTIIAAGGGGTWSYHFSEPRPLTNRERARLQTFPDDFEFIGSISDVRKQIGNSVPTEGVRPVARELKKILEGKATIKKTVLEDFTKQKTSANNDLNTINWLKTENSWNKRRKYLEKTTSTLAKHGLANWRGMEVYSPNEVNELVKGDRKILFDEIKKIIKNHIEFYEDYYGSPNSLNPRMNQCEYNLYEANKIFKRKK